jgi:hypothetical protein
MMHLAAEASRSQQIRETRKGGRPRRASGIDELLDEENAARGRRSASTPPRAAEPLKSDDPDRATTRPGLRAIDK